MTEEWIDIDWTVDEAVMVLQSDRTWKRYEGERFKIEMVEFEGTPEEVADELQQLRDAVEWEDGHYCKLHRVRVGAREGGKVSFRISLHLTNGARGFGPLLDLKRAVLKIITRTLLTTRNYTQQILMDSMAAHALGAQQGVEDELFLRQLETAIRVHREDRSGP